MSGSYSMNTTVTVCHVKGQFSKYRAGQCHYLVVKVEANQQDFTSKWGAMVDSQPSA